MSTESSLSNPGQLKLELMLKGVRVDPAFYQKKLVASSYKLAENIYAGLDLKLQQHVPVVVPYQEDFVAQSPYQLRLIRGRTVLTQGKYSIPVDVLPPPSFLDQEVGKDLKLIDIAECHGGYVGLAMAGHRYLKPILPEIVRVPTVDEVLWSLDAIRKGSDLRVVGLSSWEDTPDDGGALQVEAYVRAIKSWFNVQILTELHLPPKVNVIDRTFASGVNSVCYHFSNLKSDATYKLLAHAVSVFQPGGVSAHVSIGEATPHELISAIDRLTAIGVVPLLTFSREAVIKEGLGVPALAGIYAHVYDAVKRNRLPLQWFKNLGPFFAPVEGQYLTGRNWLVSNLVSPWDWFKKIWRKEAL